MIFQYKRKAHHDSHLSQYSFDPITCDEFLMMLRMRYLHHSAFFRPVDKMIEESLSLFSRLDTDFLKPYNGLFVFIGGKYGLSGRCDEYFKWLSISEKYSAQHDLTDFHKRNIRKLSGLDRKCALSRRNTVTKKMPQQ